MKKLWYNLRNYKLAFKDGHIFSQKKMQESYPFKGKCQVILNDVESGFFGMKNCLTLKKAGVKAKKNFSRYRS